MTAESDAAALSPVISVRGEAHISVEPDQVTLHGQLNVLRPSAPEALTAASVAVDTMKAALTGLGGVALDPTTSRDSLTWLIRRVHTRPEGNPQVGLTGNIFASVQWQIGLRDFTMLEAVQAAVDDPHLHQVHQAQWHVDRDNPAWTAVRMEAVTDALRRAREYASALSTELISLEHLADSGLLGGDGTEFSRGRRVPLAASAASYQGPNLDPVPQEVWAVVEARFRVTPVNLARLGGPV